MKLAAVALLAGCGMAACRVDPAEETGLYRRALGVENAESESAVGGKLELRRAMRLANERNEQLAIDGEAYLRAVIDRRRAAAAWLPRIALSPSYFVRDEVGGATDGVDVPATARLDVNPRAASRDVARAEAEIERRRALLFAAQDGLLVDVARVFFATLAAERSVRVLRGSLAVQEARVEDVRARRDVGIARPLDVALSESSLADVRVALVQAEREVREGRALLGFAMGVPVGEAELDARVEVSPELRSLEFLDAAAAERRPDLAAARAEVETAAREAELAAAEWWPSVTIDAAWFFTRDSVPTDQDWRGFVAVNLPLFDGGRIHANVRDALSRLRAAQAVYALSRRTVRRDLEIATANLESGERRVEALGVQLASAREAFAQAEGLYDAGLATNLERLTAQDDALRTELALQQAELDRVVLRFDLLRATGEIAEWLGVRRELGGGDAAPR